MERTKDRDSTDTCASNNGSKRGVVEDWEVNCLFDKVFLLWSCDLVKELTALDLERVVAGEGGNAHELRPELVEEADVEGGAVGWVIGLLHDFLELLFGCFGSPVGLEVVDDFLCGGSVQTADEGKEGSLVTHVVVHDGSSCNLSFCDELVW